MTPRPSDLEAPALLASRLREIDRARARLAAATLALRALAITAAITIAASLADAAIELPPLPRLLALCVVASALGAGLIAAARHLARSIDLVRAAELIDRRVPGTLRRVRPAAELLDRAADPTAAGALARRAAVRALEAIPPTTAPMLTPERRARARAASILATAAFGALVLALLAPRLIPVAIARAIAPWEDIPPYSATTLELILDSPLIAPGQDVRLTAIATGSPVDALDLWVAGDNAPPARLAMHATPDAQTFTARLLDVRTPLRAWAQVGRARSRVVHLTIDPTPRIISAATTITPPAYTRQPPRTSPLEPGPVAGASALQGSTLSLRIHCAAPPVTVEARSNLPALPASRIEQSSIALDIQLSEPGSFDIALTPRGPTASSTTPGVALRIDVHPDRAPQITWTHAPPANGLRLDARPLVRVAANDDVALDRVAMIWSRLDAQGRWAGSGILDPAPSDDPDTAERSLTLSAQDLGALPGDTLLFTPAAADARPLALGGPQFALAPSARRRVLPAIHDSDAPSAPPSPLDAPGSPSPQDDPASSAADAARAARVAPGAPPQTSAAPSPARSSSDASIAPAPSSATDSPLKGPPSPSSPAEQPALAGAGADSSQGGRLVRAAPLSDDLDQREPDARLLRPEQVPAFTLERTRPAPRDPQSAAPRVPSPAALDPDDIDLAQRYFRLLQQSAAAPAGPPDPAHERAP